MKIMKFALASLLILATFTFISCDVENGADDRPDAVAKIANDGSIELLISKDDAISLIDSRDVNGEKAAYVEEVLVEGEKGAYYLVARGKTEDGNCLTKAIEVADEGDGYIGGISYSATIGRIGDIEVIGDTHSCAGDPCSACSFIRSSEIGIVGCKCLYPSNGKCNHTVTSG